MRNEQPSRSIAIHTWLFTRNDLIESQYEIRKHLAFPLVSSLPGWVLKAVITSVRFVHRV